MGWCCCTFLKGSNIPNNTIIGTGSLLSKKFVDENTIIAGIPAKVVKRGVGWDRAYIPVYERDMKQKDNI